MDHQLVATEFLECINSLLSGGEVPGLYAPEELDPLLSPLNDEMRAEGVHNSLYAFFVARVQRNLHVALSMDPTNDSFLLRCESNPAIYTRCAILWDGGWSDNGMREVSRSVLADLLNEVRHPALPTAFPLPFFKMPFLGLPPPFLDLPLPFHCLSLTFHCGKHVRPAVPFLELLTAFTPQPIAQFPVCLPLRVGCATGLTLTGDPPPRWDLFRPSDWVPTLGARTSATASISFRYRNHHHSACAASILPGRLKSFGQCPLLESVEWKARERGEEQRSGAAHAPPPPPPPPARSTTRRAW